MNSPVAFRHLAIAVGLGLLVGLQRERAKSDLAGLRTFPLITMLGAICGMLGVTLGGWIPAAGFLALAALIVIGNVVLLKQGATDPGLTTEIAILLMFGVGATLVNGNEGIAIAVGGAVAVLLQFKGSLHGLAAKLGDEDLKAIMQFALLSLVILPVLPDQAFGPYGVWNPRQIWWMVVLIVGISLGGYVAYKFLGERTGLALSGILGGLISSTATTVSYARRTAQLAEASRQAATVIMIASTVAIVRILVEIGVVAPAFLGIAGPPLVFMLVLAALLSAGIWFSGSSKEQVEMPLQQNPTELRPALLFGLLYAVALFAIAAAKNYLGSGGLYVIAALSGLTDMDAISLSTTRLVSTGSLDPDNGWRLILVALLANVAFKGGLVALLGHRRLFARIAPLYAITLAAGALLLWLWPNAVTIIMPH
jgi:uncharacterized membrane protein (DUF4010 family)